MVASMLNEATDGRFSTDELNNIPYFKDRVKYCEKHLGDHIGMGSSRVVFQIDDNKVLKLAWNECGREQNLEEVEWSNKPYIIFPKVYSYDKDYGDWMISEYVLPAKEEDFERCIGLTWKEFVNFMWSIRERINPSVGRDYEEWEIEQMTKRSPFLRDFEKYLMESLVSCADTEFLPNWGLANRDGGMPVLLDAGWRNGLERYFQFQ